MSLVNRAKEGPWERSIRTVLLSSQGPEKAGGRKAEAIHPDLEESLIRHVGHRLEEQDWASGQ